jgi:glycerol-3-phosphate dehydrogenase
LVFSQARFPLRQSTYFDTPDGRMVFAIPRDGKTYVGTTDTNYRGELMNPRFTQEDRDYLLHAANEMFPDLKLKAADVESSWTGLRPLIHQEGKNPSEISRKDEIFVSSSGLISIAGGKLTGYRKMAETVVNLISHKLQAEGHKQISHCLTRAMPISGGDVGGAHHFEHFVHDRIQRGKDLGLTDKEADQLVRRYGSNIDEVYRLMDDHRIEAANYGLPVWLLALLIYSIEAEMTVLPVDFFIRRTGALFFNIEFVKRWQEPVVAYMTDRFGWTSEQRHKFMEQLDTHLHEAVIPV